MRRPIPKSFLIFLCGFAASPSMAIEPDAYLERVKPRLANLECPKSTTGLLTWTDAVFPDQDDTKEATGAWTVLMDIRNGKPVRLRLRVYLREDKPVQGIVASGTFDEGGKLISGKPEDEKGLRNNMEIGALILDRFCARGRPTEDVAATIAGNRRKIGWPWPNMQLD